MAHLVYNDVYLSFEFTRSVQSDPAYTPDGMDCLGVDHTFSVEGIVHANDGADLAAEYERIRHALDQPRKNLVYSVDGATVIRSGPGLDLRNGPFPELISLDHVLGTLTFHVSYVVRTRLHGCPQGRPPSFLSNRFSEQVNIGDDHLTKITRTGTLFTRTNVFADSDAARGVVTPPIAKDFNRIEAEYQIQSDGLALTYRFVDVQVEHQPPGPAIRIDFAQYVESSPDGAKRYGQVRVGLTGRPGGSRKALLGTAILIGVRRLQAAGALRPDAPAPVIFSLREDLHRNRCEFMAQVVLIPIMVNKSSPHHFKNHIETTGRALYYAEGKHSKLSAAAEKADAEVRAEIAARELEAAAGLPKLGELKGWGAGPALSNPNSIPDPGLRGTAGIVLIASALQDPCLANAFANASKKTNGVIGAGAPAGGVTKGGPVAAKVSVVNAVTPFGPAEGITKLAPSLYTDYRVTCRWEEDMHIAHMAPTDTEAESATVALAAPTKQLIVEYKATRMGGPPAIPRSELGPNYVLLARSKQPREANLTADGTGVSSTAGWMAYAVLDPSKADDGGAVPAWAVDQLRALKQLPSPPGSTDLDKMLALAAGSAGGTEDAGILPWANQQA